MKITFKRIIAILALSLTTLVSVAQSNFLSNQKKYSRVRTAIKEKNQTVAGRLRASLLIACALWLLLRFVVEMWFRRQASCLARNHNEEQEPQKKPLWVRLKHLSASL